MRLQSTLLFFAAGSTLGQIFVPRVVSELAQYALKIFDEYVDHPVRIGRNSTLGIQVSVEVNVAATCTSSYWLENIAHQGKAAFNSNPSGYQVYRNVKDFGAKGDGVNDDTAAINAAISSGNRCGIGETCGSSTTTPAVVYFPAGTYMISSSIVDLYYTQIIGNPNCMPTIRAFPYYSGSFLGMIDANPYSNRGNLAYGATNVFWREIKNLIIDMTLVPASTPITGIHWPTAQATNLQNIIFQMSSVRGTQHQGIFIESGSGGFVSDLTFNGGLYGGNWGNQQFTMRNLHFNNVVTAINQIWDWGWTYQNININNCTVGLNMSSGGRSNIAVGSVTLLDSTISNTQTGIITAHDANSQPGAGGSLIIENLKLNNVPVAIRGPDGPRLSGVSSIAGWSEGHSYTPNGPNNVQGQMTPVTRPSSLLQADGKYYQRSKPSYANLPVSSFLSARTAGATGDGRTDDTTALQNAINNAKSQNKILYLDHGNYRVTRSIYIPGGAKIVGEAYSVIMSAGSFFNDMSNPQPVVKIGNSGETGSVELSEFIISTQGQQKGATLIEYNLASPAGSPSGLWDVHTRIGGFAGSDLQLGQCAKTPGTTITSANLVQNCISGFLHMHITKPATGLYLENVWLWTADHDIEAASLGQITIYTGRGLLDESTNGPVWLVGTGVEHNQRYEYQFLNTKNVWAGQIQTETAYYQPNPNAKIPFPVNEAYGDPTYPGPDTITDQGAVVPAVNGWGVRIVNSQAIAIYGAGLYSFFNNYSTSCSDQGNGSVCQHRIATVLNSNAITIYNLNTVGTRFQISVDGKDVARYASNPNGFVQTIALFKK